MSSLDNITVLKYQNRYNTKFNSNLSFFGHIQVLKLENGYDYLNINLTVFENNEKQYAGCKEFFIKDRTSYTNNPIKMGRYELIDIINDLDSLYLDGLST